MIFQAGLNTCHLRHLLLHKTRQPQSCLGDNSIHRRSTPQRPTGVNKGAMHAQTTEHTNNRRPQLAHKLRESSADKTHGTTIRKKHPQTVYQNQPIKPQHELLLRTTVASAATLTTKPPYPGARSSCHPLLRAAVVAAIKIA